ncbi:EamA family transporter, partial [Pseudomonas aeruginosa]
MLSAAFYVVISSRLIKSFEPITLLSGQLTFSLILSSLFIFISKSSIYLPLESVIIVFSSGILQYFLAFCFYLNSLRWLPVHLAGIMLYFIPLVAL